MPARLQQRHKLTPYAGRALCGAVAHDVRARRARVGQEPARARVRRTTAMSAAFRRARRSRVRAARRRGRRGERRVLRAEGEPAQGRRAGLARGRVHRSRQVDGRLGDAPPARPRARRARLVHRPARRAAASCAASTSTPRSSPATIPESCAIDACDLPGLPARRGAEQARVARDAAAHARSTGDAHNLFAIDARAAGDAPAAAHLSRTAASRGCASTARSSPTGSGCAASGDVDLGRGRARRHASSRAATCSSGRGTT